MKRGLIFGAALAFAAAGFAQEGVEGGRGFRLRAGYGDVAVSGYYEHDDESSDMDYESEGWNGSVVTLEAAWVDSGWEAFCSLQHEGLQYGDEARVGIGKARIGAEWNSLGWARLRGLHAGAAFGIALPPSDFPEVDGRARKGEPYPTFELLAGYRFPIESGWRIGTDVFLSTEFMKRTYEADGAPEGDAEVWGGFEFGLGVTFEYAPGRRN